MKYQEYKLQQKVQRRRVVTRVALLERHTGLTVGVVESELALFWLAIASGYFRTERML